MHMTRLQLQNADFRLSLTLAGAAMLLVTAGCGSVEDGSELDGGGASRDGGGASLDGGGTSLDGGGGADAAPACGETETCAPAVPQGWNGPVTLVSDAESCPDAMPEQLELSHTSLDAPAASCQCSCGNATDFSCTGNLVVQARSNICSAEVFGFDEVTLPEETVVNTSSTPASSFSIDEGANPIPHVTGGQCAPSEDFSIPAASFTDALLTCGPGAGAGSCEGGGTCLEAAGGSAPTCIYQAGDTECPDGPYTERTVSYREILDTRVCSSCTCAAPVGDCHGVIGFWIDGQFTNALFSTLDGCIDLSFTPNRAEFFPDPVSAGTVECAPAGGELVGEAVLDDAITTCCLPD